MSFQVKFKASALKELSKLPAEDKRRVQAALVLLADSARPPSSRKLVGRSELRVRVGRLRILYLLDAQEALIIVKSVRDRSSVYKRR